MKQLFQSTKLYAALSASGKDFFSQTVLAVFPDAVYLKEYLKECAKQFFYSEDGGRRAELIEKEIFSDLLIYPAEGKKYTVELCEQILEESLLLPVESLRKLIVLTDFQTAPALVQNKLLKVLEEPPEAVGFLLGATTQQPVLPTILSRVKKIYEAPFEAEQIRQALTRKYSAKEWIPAAAASCGGLLSTAERFMARGGELFRFALQFLDELGGSSLLDAGKDSSEDEMIAALRTILRDLFFYQKGAGRFASGIAGAEELSRKYPAGAVLFALEELDRMQSDLALNANFQSSLLAFALKVKEEIDKWKKLS